MHSIDDVLQLMQHHDHQRSRLLRAMESKASSSSGSMLSIENYFQTEKQRAVRAINRRVNASQTFPRSA